MNWIINAIILTVPFIYIVTSITLFIIDGIKAKKESRTRMISIAIMFGLSLEVAGWYILTLIVFIGLATGKMRLM